MQKDGNPMLWKKELTLLVHNPPGTVLPDLKIWTAGKSAAAGRQLTGEKGAQIVPTNQLLFFTAE